MSEQRVKCVTAHCLDCGSYNCGIEWEYEADPAGETVQDEFAEDGDSRLKAENERLQAEVDVLRGKDCEADGDGPCGVCLKCARRSVATTGATEANRETARERIEELEKALRELIPVNCDALHHDKRDRHEGSASCPVIERALAALRRSREGE